MANLLDFEGLMNLEPSAVATWVFFIAIIVGGFLLARKIGSLNAERAKRVKEFAMGLGLTPMPGVQMTSLAMHYEGTRNGRKVGLGVCIERAGRTGRNPKMFAYAHCDPKGFEMTMEHGIFRVGGPVVKSGDGEIDRHFFIKANDPLKARRMIDIDTVARIKGIWKKEKEVNRLPLSQSTLIFIGRNRLKESDGSLLSFVAGSLAGKPRTMPMERIPEGQGIVFIEKGLPGLGVGLDKEMLSLLLDLAVSLAEKAER